MKQAEDDKTIDMLGQAKRGRGRPATGKPPKTTSAQRMKAHRDRLLSQGVGVVTIKLPLDVIDALDKYIEFKGLQKDQVIEKLVRAHLLRKR